MTQLDELKTTVELCMFDLYGTIVDMQAGLTARHTTVSLRQRVGVVSPHAWSPGGGARTLKTR